MVGSERDGCERLELDRFPGIAAHHPGGAVKNTARPLREFAYVLWLPIVCSLPIALFFGTLDWLGWLGYVIAYKITLVFTYPIALSVWVTRSFVLPRTPTRSARRRHIWSREVL